jgi:hypothetical protein
MELEGVLKVPEGWFGIKKYLCRPTLWVDTYEGEKLDKPVAYLFCAPARSDRAANTTRHIFELRYLDGKRIRLKNALRTTVMFNELCLEDDNYELC